MQKKEENMLRALNIKILKFIKRTYITPVFYVLQKNIQTRNYCIYYIQRKPKQKKYITFYKFLI